MSEIGENILRPEILIRAYSTGYFPFPHPESEEILWLRPDPRAVIPLDGFHVSRSLRKTLGSGQFEITKDNSFREVMDGCAAREETWIDADFKLAYGKLHDLGFAHSLEVRMKGKLVGGVYGIALGGAFFAESKFHLVTDASKVALFHLVEHLRQREYRLLEVQFMTPHLKGLGAVEISDENYMVQLAAALGIGTSFLD